MRLQVTLGERAAGTGPTVWEAWRLGEAGQSDGYSQPALDSLAHLPALLDPGAWQRGGNSMTPASVGAGTMKACGLYMVLLLLMRPWLLA